MVGGAATGSVPVALQGVNTLGQTAGSAFTPKPQPPPAPLRQTAAGPVVNPASDALKTDLATALNAANTSPSTSPKLQQLIAYLRANGTA